MKAITQTDSGIDESVLRLRDTPRTFWWILGVCLVILSIIWLLVPWEWSTIDDPGFVLGLQQRIAEHGFLGGQASSLQSMFASDIDWGLFRPSYWAYPGLFYLLPVELAHLVRLFMLLVAIAGPLVFMRRRGASSISLIAAGLVLVTASSGLIVGLEFTSLQELSGAAFVGLGFVFPRAAARLTLWTIAAWFKAPFAWLLIGYAIPLWRRGQRASAILSASLGLGTIVLAAAMARNGDYTARFYRNSIGLILDAVLSNGPKFFELPTLLVLVAFAWWVLLARPQLRFDAMTITLLIAVLGYSANLISWTVSGYYIGPVILLLGILLVSTLGVQRQLNKPRLAAALAMPLIIAAWITSTSVGKVFTANEAIVQARDCLLGLPTQSNTALSGDLTYVATLEGADRLSQIATLSNSSWQGSVTFVDVGSPALPQGTTHYLWVSSKTPTDGLLPFGKLQCSTPLVTVVTLANP
jgi:hypothetical protein